MGRALRIRGRQRDHEQAIAREFGRLGERLSERKLRLEAAGGQVALIVELARVGLKLVAARTSVGVIENSVIAGVEAGQDIGAAR